MLKSIAASEIELILSGHRGPQLNPYIPVSTIVSATADVLVIIFCNFFCNFSLVEMCYIQFVLIKGHH